jgi:phage recombination protein Bet
MNQIQPMPQTNWPMPAVPDFLNKEEIALLKKTILAKFTEEEQDTFIRMVLRTRLDPWSRQIYATRRQQKITDESGQVRKVPMLVPVTSIMGLTAIADRTGHYKGCVVHWSGPDGVWKEEWLSDEYPAAARAAIYHSQRNYPEIGIARWRSYAGQTFNYQTKIWEVSDFWDRMPDFMLQKCARAQALRAAFPDQLSNVYIREELESNITDSELDTEEIPSMEAKIDENQRREAEAKKQGVKFVETTGGKRPTPAEAAEPAFEEDKVPKKVAATQKKPEAKPEVVPAPPEVAQEPAFSQQLKQDFGQQAPPPDEPPPPPPPPPWKEHLILGVSHPKYHKRKVGELTQQELTILESQWLPKVRAQWDEANEAQRADAAAFEAAIAFYKMEKPW